MALFTLNRDHVLRSIHGHTVAFAKGAPAWVPPSVEAEARAIGAEAVKGADALKAAAPETASKGGK